MKKTQSGSSKDRDESQSPKGHQDGKVNTTGSLGAIIDSNLSSSTSSGGATGVGSQPNLAGGGFTDQQLVQLTQLMTSICSNMLNQRNTSPNEVTNESKHPPNQSVSLGVAHGP